MKKTSPLSTKTQKAIAKYGRKICIEACEECDVVGNGASTIAFEFGLQFNSANAAINAGREIREKAGVGLRERMAQ